ncbi:MAG: SprT-like domain-containing protein, partial [Deltaproteobacteria bacterium]|nr:SprT-like domain-containing protein [Deltaproteobacteria bacterium]
MSDLADLRPHVDAWCRLWGVEALAEEARVELSSRMTHSLGRAYCDRNLVRLAARLEQGPREFLEEVLCHELAHLAAARRSGRRVKPHGAEWKALMRAAGYPPA